MIFDREHLLTKNLTKDDDMYFVHSYHLQLQDLENRLAYVNYSGEITAIVAKIISVEHSFIQKKVKKQVKSSLKIF